MAAPGSGPRYLKGDDITALAAVSALIAKRPATKVEKLRFDADGDIISIVDSGQDHFTFDNKWPHASPKTCFRKRALKRTSRPEGMNPKLDETIPHQVAMSWMAGDIVCKLPAACALTHEGLVPSYPQKSDWGWPETGPDDEDFFVDDSLAGSPGVPNLLWQVGRTRWLILRESWMMESVGGMVHVLLRISRSTS